MLYPVLAASPCALRMALCPEGADVMFTLADACSSNSATPVALERPKPAAVCAKTQYSVPCSSPLTVGMSVIATETDDGTVPELVDVKEPAIVTGALAAPVPVSEHVVGGFVADATETSPVPAWETPRSYRVLAARPVPEIAVDPPTLTTVGAAIRLVLSWKSMSPNCVFCVVLRPASLSK